MGRACENGPADETMYLRKREGDRYEKNEQNAGLFPHIFPEYRILSSPFLLLMNYNFILTKLLKKSILSRQSVVSNRQTAYFLRSFSNCPCI